MIRALCAKARQTFELGAVASTAGLQAKRGVKPLPDAKFRRNDQRLVGILSAWRGTVPMPNANLNLLELPDMGTVRRPVI